MVTVKLLKKYQTTLKNNIKPFGLKKFKIRVDNFLFKKTMLPIFFRPKFG